MLTIEMDLRPDADINIDALRVVSQLLHNQMACCRSLCESCTEARQPVMELVDSILEKK